MNMGNLQKLALTAQEALQNALSIASDAQAAQAEPIHLLKALLTSGENNLSAIIKRIGADSGSILNNVNAEIARAPKVSSTSGGMMAMMAGVPSNKVNYSSMEEAFDYLEGNSKPGDVCLLSPAASSYDQYKNFEERGAKFKRLAQAFGPSSRNGQSRA